MMFSKGGKRQEPLAQLSDLDKLSVQQSKKVNDLAIDRDLFKLHYRIGELLDGSKEGELDSSFPKRSGIPTKRGANSGRRSVAPR